MNDYGRHGNETDLKDIDRVRDSHVAALNAGDAKLWAAQFTEDGVQMPPNAPANTGRAMIEAWSHSFLGQFRVQFALTVDEMHVLRRPAASGCRQIPHGVQKEPPRFMANGARHMEQQ